MDDAKLAKQATENAALARARKARLAAAMDADLDVPANELLAVARLEREVANMESLLRLRALTREPDAGA